MNKRTSFGAIALPVLLLTRVGVAHARDLTFEDRVKAQEAIERVYWSHRIWPKENPQPKPSLEELMPEAVIRDKVEDYLRKSECLAKLWNRPITADQLRAEVARMGKKTRRAEILRDLFSALHDDPLLIGECLARPSLADRLIRSWYATEERFHGSIRRKAQEAVARAAGLEDLRRLGDRDNQITLKLDARQNGGMGPTSESVRGWDQMEVNLGEQEWNHAIEDILRRFGARSVPNRRVLSAVGVPLQKPSALQEDDRAFFVTVVVGASGDTLTIATVAWLKVPFEHWWRHERASHSPEINLPSAKYLPVALSSSACADDTWSPMPYGAPDSRSEHTAIWTGTEMIIWGGYTGASLLNTGGQYNPATDTWTPTSTVNAPRARTGHAAIWTGTEMIVWGGNSVYPQEPIGTGGRYNPATDTWTPTSTGANAPSGRLYHTAVWTGTEMIVWGGEYINTGGRYNPTADTWLPTNVGPLTPTRRYSHTAVWMGSQMIVWGGRDPQGPYLNSGALYDPTSDTWTPTSMTGDLPVGRGSHSAVWTGREMIVWGGIGDSFPYGMDSGGRYDPVTLLWNLVTVSAETPATRRYHTAIWTGTEMIVWGGEVGGQGANSGGVYTPSSDTWRQTSAEGTTPSSRSLHTAIWTGSEMIIWGGRGVGGHFQTGGRYDPASDSWVRTGLGPGIPLARWRPAAVWTGAEMLIWGGYSNESGYDIEGGRFDPATETWSPIGFDEEHDVPRGDSLNALWSGREMIVCDDGNSIGRYNPLTNNWTTRRRDEDTPPGGQTQTAVWTGTELIVWGGYAGANILNTGARYSPETNVWMPTSTGPGVPAGRGKHTAIWTGRGMIIWGGQDARSMVTTGGRYDPHIDNWRPINASGAPLGRQYPKAVWTGRQMIVWGGSIGRDQAVNTGGRYDPISDSWTPVRISSQTPGARVGHTAVWTGSEMIVWGGNNGEYYYANTGGRYDPVIDSWRAMNTDEGVPSPRTVHAGVWTGSELIVWGGYPMTATGGRYCAVSSCSVVPWYRDEDEDGHGLATDSVLSCDPPPGYASLGGDCNDHNPAVHPGAVEVCNGLDDDCNGIADEDANILCDDASECTIDTCMAEAGCQHATSPDGAPCDDGDACTLGDLCAGGVCRSGRAAVPKVDCNDGNRCTRDYCDPEFGCFHGPVLCHDGDPRTTDSCDPHVGCVFTPRMPPRKPTEMRSVPE